jgi:hypothetical protein
MSEPLQSPEQRAQRYALTCGKLRAALERLLNAIERDLSADIENEGLCADRRKTLYAAIANARGELGDTNV